MTCFIIYPFIANWYQYIFLLIPFGMSSGICNTLINSLVSKEVDPTLIGGAFGLSASIGSLTRIIAPSISGLLVDHIGIEGPYVLSFLLSGLILLLTHTHVLKEKNL